MFAQHIWGRWQQGYLQTLQSRSKWNTLQDNLKIGDLVVIHDSQRITSDLETRSHHRSTSRS
ncbi:hypothetical protein J6590_083508 [Homalodisca vitripennis]|nr:hypothetical protein J6590_083508 [Homalodisca vitripennis]